MSFRTKVATRNGAYRERPLSEYDDVHVQWLEVCRAVRVLVERAETNQVVISEKLDLLSRFLHLDILRREGVNAKHLRK